MNSKIGLSMTRSIGTLNIDAEARTGTSYSGWNLSGIDGKRSGNSTFRRQFLPKKPAFTEKNQFSIDDVAVSPNQIIEYLKIQAQSEDYVVLNENHNQYKISCAAIACSKVLIFIISLYDGENGKVIVEFQRRKGDPIKFYEFFQKIKSLAATPQFMCGVTSHTESKSSKLSKCIEYIEINVDLLMHISNQIVSNDSSIQSQAINMIANLLASRPEILKDDNIRSALSAVITSLPKIGPDVFFRVDLIISLTSLMTFLSSSVQINVQLSENELWISEHLDILTQFICNREDIGYLERILTIHHLLKEGGYMALLSVQKCQNIPDCSGIQQIFNAHIVDQHKFSAASRVDYTSKEHHIRL